MEEIEFKLTSSEIYDKDGNYHPNGIFSEQIFGPLKDYTCQCGIVRMGAKGTRCHKCGVKFIKSQRSDTGAYIELPFKILNPIALHLIYAYDSSIKSKIGRYSVDVIQEIDEIIQRIIDTEDQKLTNKELKIKNLWKNSEDLIYINKIYVIPPDLRPVSGNTNSYVTDDLNHYYQNILSHLEQLSVEEIPKTEYHQLIIMKTLYEMYLESIIEKVSQRSGVIRQRIFGKRVDFSGRTVATIDPTLDLDTIRVPYKILASIFSPFIFFSHPVSSVDAYRQISDYLNDKPLHPELKSTIDSIANVVPVVINRQPTLHRPSMRAFKVVPTEKLTIQVNPYIVDGFNLDFDGDQMAIYAPLFQEEIDEYLYKFINHKNQIVPGNLKFASISQFGYCVYYMSKNDPNQNNIVQNIDFNFSLSREDKIKIADSLHADYTNFSDSIAVNVKSGDNSITYLTTKGRFILSCYLNMWIDEPINKSKFNFITTVNIFDVIENKGFNYDYEDLEYLDKLLHSYLIHIPVTISIRDFTDIFELPQYKENIEKLENSTRSNETKQLVALLEDIIKENIEYTGNINNIIRSGAKGSFSSIKQLLVCKGNVMTPQKTIVPYFIRRNLVKGLSEQDMYIMSFGARKGSLDRSVNTADTGYLMRKLIFAMNSVEYDPTLKDCGTDRYIPVTLTKENYLAYIFKYFSTHESDEIHLLTHKNYSEYLGKELKIYSPIMCKSEKICTKCYGAYYNVFNSKYIGIIGAQSIGERCTQLTMRTFHTGGVAEDIRDFINKDFFNIIEDLVITKKPINIELIDTNIDIDNLIPGYELEDDVYIIEESTGKELHIPKGCTLRINLKPRSKIPANSEIAIIPLSKISNVTSVVDYVMKQIEMPPEDYTWEELYDLLMSAFYYTEGIISVHLETLISQMMRNPEETSILSRLSDDPDNYKLLSIKKIPSHRKLLALSFQYFHKNLIDNLTEHYNKPAQRLTVMEKIIKGIDLKFVRENLDMDLEEKIFHFNPSDKGDVI